MPQLATKGFSCFLIGGDSLLIRCAELLLQNDCAIYGIISADGRNRVWADRHEIPNHGPDASLAEVLGEHPFDYLFSVGNSLVLAPDILSLPKKGSINYHDSPLPKYAGMHATAWAIMNQERDYAVSWHIVEAGIDTGDILKQTPLQIAGNETSLSLNTKCYEAAAGAFAELVHDLLHGSAQRVAQDLGKRSYFALNKRPPCGGVLFFNQPASAVGAFVRALTFGDAYPNPLVAPKIVVGDDYFIVESLLELEDASSAPAGTVVALDDAAVTVATATHDVAIRRILSIDGDPVPLGDLAHRFGLACGDLLAAPGPRVAARLTEGVRQTCRHERFWVERLRDLQLPQLPYMRSTAVDHSAEPATTRLEVPDAFRAYAISATPDPVHAVLSAFVAYLARICDAEGFDIGLIRPDDGSALSPAYFARTVPLRVEPDLSVDFSRFSDTLQHGLDSVRRHGTYARDVRYRYPGFNAEPAVRDTIGLPAAIGSIDTLADLQGLQYAGLSLVFVAGEDAFFLVSHPRAIGRDNVLRMAAQFRVLLQGIAAHPQSMLSELPLLTQAELRQLLVEWNDTARGYPQGQCMHQLFEAQAVRAPAAVALVHEGQQLTYAELDARANRLAHHLRGLGITADMRVAICVERSLEMVVALLGVLKAGAAYVPLDPDYPAERLAFMLSDSAASVLLTQQRLLHRLPQSPATRVCLDTGWDQVMLQPAQPPAVALTPRNLAYVIYTSGSTGTPKGVAIEHRSIVDHCYAICEHNRLSAADRVFQFASFSFDASVEEILPTLSMGATVVLGRHRLKDPADLDAGIRNHGVTMVHLPPAFFREWVRLYSADYPPPHTLQLIVVGGDVLAREAVLWWKGLPGNNARLINSYGPTEVTVSSVFHAIDDVRDGSIPIGRPLNNIRLYVLDRNRQPVPVGVSGELYIGGIGVARGYLNRPELTAQRFMQNPFGEQQADDRLYRSGDRVRYQEDGAIEFLGRIDQQVKIRGFRIEPGEIESVLRQFQAVQDTVVLVREERPGDKRLVAYITAAPGADPAPAALREFLLRKLPEHMVPSAYVRLHAMPVNASGKLDRKALPEPGRESLPRTHGFVAPATPAEQALCDIWEDVLGVERIGMHDNFFELGGNSLSGIHLVAEINGRFCIRMHLHSLFDMPTVAAQGREIERLQREALAAETAQQRSPRVTAPDTTGPFIPLLSAQQGFWIEDRLDPGNSAHNIAHEYSFSGALDPGLLERSLGEIVNRHEALRTTFTLHGDDVSQTIAAPAPFALPVVDLAELPREMRYQELQRRIAADSDTGFDLQRGPLLRATLFRLSGLEHVLLTVIHHIVFDGWSAGIFNRELEALYGAYRKGLPSPLPGLRVRYADYALWERKNLHAEELDKLLRYWKEKLADVPRLKLPVDRLALTYADHRVAHRELQLSPELAAALKQLAAREKCSLFMVLTAALKVLLHRHSGQEDIVVGAPIAGRRNLETHDGTIGAFINTIVLRTDLSGNPEFCELLRRERNVALGAYQHSMLPFDRLVEELSPQRKPGLNPFVDVLVNYGEESWSGLHLEGVDACRIRNVERRSSFALSLAISDYANGLSLQLRYQLACFSDAQIGNLLEQFRDLLEQASSAPQQRIASFSLLTQAARRLLPDPAVPIPEPQVDRVTDCFADRVRQSPQQAAIRQGGRDWSYQTLADCSQAQAGQLLALGVQAGDVVAVSGARSFGLVSAMLAVFLSGGILLTLDRSLPPVRQRLMLSEARAKFMVRIVAAPGSAGSDDALPLMQVDANSGEVLAAPAERSGEDASLPRLAGDDPAYIFFTSGSTGVPKGILGTHKGMAHMIAWQRATFSITPQDRCAQLIHLSFDAVLRDIFLPLTSGATLCLPQEDEAEGARLLQWMARERITLLHTVPSLAQSWLEDAPPDLSLPALRWMFFSGEPLNGILVRHWQDRACNCGFINLYGPTETTLIKICHILPAEVDPVMQPIGRPLPDTQILVLGEQGKMCGLGEPGEIVIRTPFSTLGYLNEPEQGRNGFAKNPFRDDAHDRVYFTGDRGFFDANGLLHILGRLDHQVKINGVRIEPDEVTAVLAQFGAIRSCAVIGRKNAGGKDVLVAYVVPQQPDADIAAEARAFLAQRLPFAMVPGVYIPLQQLPLNPNGKLDRDKLPAWDEDCLLPKQARAEPATPTEKLLAAIWQEVLKAEMIGVDDDFFALGGHSLSGMQLISRINRTFNIELPLPSLFDKSTISALSREIDRLQNEAILGGADLERILQELEIVPDAQGV